MTNPNENGTININGTDPPCTKNFKYLGSVITTDGDMRPEITTRINATWMKWCDDSRTLRPSDEGSPQIENLPSRSLSHCPVWSWMLADHEDCRKTSRCHGDENAVMDQRNHPFITCSQWWHPTTLWCGTNHRQNARSPPSVVQPRIACKRIFSCKDRPQHQYRRKTSERPSKAAMAWYATRWPHGRTTSHWPSLKQMEDLFKKRRPRYQMGLRPKKKKIRAYKNVALPFWYSTGFTNWIGRGEEYIIDVECYLMYTCFYMAWCSLLLCDSMWRSHFLSDVFMPFEQSSLFDVDV